MFSSLLECSAVSSSDDQLIGLLVLLSRLQTQERACPTVVHGPRTADTGLSFSTTMRMVVRVHNRTADGRTKYPCDACVPALPMLNQVVLSISYHTYSRSAVQGNHSHLSGGQTKGRVLAFLSHELARCFLRNEPSVRPCPDAARYCVPAYLQESQKAAGSCRFLPRPPVRS